MCRPRIARFFFWFNLGTGGGGGCAGTFARVFFTAKLTLGCCCTAARNADGRTCCSPPGAVRACSLNETEACGGSTAQTRACFSDKKKKHGWPRQKSLAPAEAQLVPWFDRLAPGRSACGPGRGEAREAREGFLKRAAVAAEGAVASAQRRLCPCQRAPDWQRPKLARAGLVALM